MEQRNNPAQPPEPSIYGLLGALLMTCSTSPAPYSTCAWGAVVVVIVVLAQSGPMKRRA
ncbi:hypothetical protein ACH437_29950 [Streptomyces xinghaiensis]|uniref:hypothetical protein n=1 Tax=Streptomyces xinghaiensis TaxID=1038928 RepID=UPI0037B291B4